MFDGIGHGVFGRVAQGMTVRYSGRRTADEVILDLTSEAAMQAGDGGRGRRTVLVVTNDRELRGRLHAKGARTVPLQWLMGRLDLPVPRVARNAATSGPPRSARGPRAGAAIRDDAGARPGLEARSRRDAKTGPPRKVARHKRHPRTGA